MTVKAWTENNDPVDEVKKLDPTICNALCCYINGCIGWSDGCTDSCLCGCAVKETFCCIEHDCCCNNQGMLRYGCCDCRYTPPKTCVKQTMQICCCVQMCACPCDKEEVPVVVSLGGLACFPLDAGSPYFSGMPRACGCGPCGDLCCCMPTGRMCCCFVCCPTMSLVKEKYEVMGT